jgi:hypothetical protein
MRAEQLQRKAHRLVTAWTEALRGFCQVGLGKVGYQPIAHKTSTLISRAGNPQSRNLDIRGSKDDSAKVT